MNQVVETQSPKPGPKPHLTPADAVNNRQELRPLPLRVANAQYERLNAARMRTGISIQEHVRRGIDLYLAVIEREAIELGLMPDRNAPTASVAKSYNQPAAQAPRPAPRTAKR
jgi:hypothetical protein